ncbi:hypothetical protein NDU88_002685 [Pleurodeles waltl]|uniref:Reverse transcriptase domain-containing protein n=1 Tax=Pleurodeles waltl TaxID=8319 RepID=A0AAV7SDF3_PLEWA|nr:hypothetical protein NDU88_002685 [Pleurodeles waltl]
MMHTLTMYADDTWIYVTDPGRSVPRLLHLMARYGEVSGLHVNRPKTVLFLLVFTIRMAEKEDANIPDIGLLWEKEQFCYPGMQMTHDTLLQYELKMGKVFRDLEISVKFWNKLLLSVLGRVALSKIVILPRSLYSMQHSFGILAAALFKRVKALLVSLVWPGRQSMVRLWTLKLNMVDGDLDLLELQLYYLGGCSNTEPCGVTTLPTEKSYC